MPLAPAIAAALNVGLTANAKGLYLDGLDVAKVGGGRGGVDPRDVTLTMAGPGQVSALAFRLHDPLNLLAPAAGQWVRFADLVADLPLFIGWISDVGYEAEGLGRVFSITCTGAEAALDWMYVPSIVFPGGSTIAMADMLRSLLAAATPIGVPLNLASAAASGSTISSPIAGFYSTTAGNSVCTTPAGSLRRAMEYAVNFVLADISQDLATVRTTETSISVDRWWGLRVWARRQGPGGTLTNRDTGAAGDHADVAISTAGPVYPADASIGFSGQDAPRSVYVKGANAAGSGTFSDGSGIVGRAASITDPATTAALAQAAGLSYLARQGPLLTGSCSIEGLQGFGSVGHLVDAQCLVTYTDTVLGITATQTWVTALRVTWAPSGEMTWELAFGATLASGAAYMRSLTQDQML